MSEYYAIEKEILVDIADATREKTGETNGILAENIAGKIREITSGIELPELTNEGSASDLLSGKQLIDGDGNKVIGNMANNGSIMSTMDGIDIKSITVPAGYTSGGTVSLDNTIDNEVDIQTDLIEQINNALEGKAGGGSGVLSGDTYTVKNNLSTNIQIGFTNILPGTSVQLPYIDSAINFMAIIVRDSSITLSATISSGDTIMCMRDFESGWQFGNGTVNMSNQFTVWLVVVTAANLTGNILEINSAN